MSKKTKYVSHTPDVNGFVHWHAEENATWCKLINKQKKLLDGRACDEFLQGLSLLNLPTDYIPQLADINSVLVQQTGWEVVAVPSLINFDEFFRLLANKQFPVATFIRTKDEFNYLQEPDIFHEVFGHCPLLTNPAFAHFTHMYGKLGYAANKADRSFLARLYWFTVEFGLVKTEVGTRIYGGGILSSPGETLHALEATECLRMPMSPLDVLRTPYRIDVMQPVYYLLDTLDSLYDIAKLDIMELVEQARTLGMYEPKFYGEKQKVC